MKIHQILPCKLTNNSVCLKSTRDLYFQDNSKSRFWNLPVRKDKSEFSMTSSVVGIHKIIQVYEYFNGLKCL